MKAKSGSKKTSWESVVGQMPEKGAIPEDVVDAMRNVQADDSRKRGLEHVAELKGLTKGKKLNPAVKFRQIGRNRPASSMTRSGRKSFLRSEHQVPPLQCSPNFNFVDEQIRNYSFGSHDTGEVVPLPAPLPWTTKGNSSSILTIPQTGEISLAAAIGYDYWPADSFLRVAGSITHIFDIPNLPNLGLGLLQATARVSGDHSGGFLDAGKSSLVGATGIITTWASVVGPVGGINLVPPAPQRQVNNSVWGHKCIDVLLEASESGKILGTVNHDPVKVLSDVDELLAGPVDVPTFVKYVPGATRVIVRVEMAIYLIKLFDSPNCGAGIDFRNIESPEAFTNGATESCPFVVEQIRLCGI